jgi:hypothetical protein
MLYFALHGSYMMNEFQPPAKPSFIYVFRHSNMDYEILVEVAATYSPKIPRSIIDDMLAGRAVLSVHAEAVLTLLSQYMGKRLTVDEVDVPLLREKGDV